MGQKYHLVVCKDSDDAILDPTPVEDERTQAERILAGLGFPRTEYLRRVRLVNELRTAHGEIGIGVYRNGCIISCNEQVTGFLRNPAKNMERRRLLSLFPTHSILVAYVYGYDCSYGYAKFLNGEFVRSQSGNTDKPVRYDEGPLFQIEKDWRSSAILRRRRRYYQFDDDDEEYDDSGIGNIIVSDLLQDHFGRPSNVIDGWEEDDLFEILVFRTFERFTLWRRSAETKTAMSVQILAAIAAGGDHEAMGHFDLPAVLTRIGEITTVELTVRSGGGDHGEWVQLECPYVDQLEVSKVLYEIACKYRLILHDESSDSLSNNQRSY